MKEDGCSWYLRTMITLSLLAATMDNDSALSSHLYTAMLKIPVEANALSF